MRPFALGAALILATVACGAGLATERTASPVPSSPAATSTPTPERTKPFPVTQQPLPPPTYARWAIDGVAAADRHRLVLFFDSVAAGFRLLDADGSVIVQIPIAGSGIFGPETCVSSARRGNENVTWTAIDDATYQRLSKSWSSYRLEVDAVAGPTLAVPLSDSGCRR